MSLNVKHSGSWREATEVHIKTNGAWERCKEVYIKKSGVWEPVLFTSASTWISAAGAGTVEVPAGAFRASITVAGASGGKGGNDGGRSGGDGGLGASLTATVDVEPFTTLSYTIATAGANGASGSGNAGGTGGTGYASGGTGGTTGTAGWSGSGGGGGGASSILMPSGSAIIVAGGGSGGGGRGNQAHLSQAEITGKNSTIITSNTDSLVATNGLNGANCGTADGGAGGGGAGGVLGPISTDRYSVTSYYQCSGGGWFRSRNCQWTTGNVTTKYRSISAISVAKQYSSEACTLNSTYGVTGSNVWTTSGCRATFNVTGAENTGVGGKYMGSYDSDGYPGEAGTSYFNDELVSTEPTASTNSGNGYINIIWLPA